MMRRLLVLLILPIVGCAAAQEDAQRLADKAANLEAQMIALKATIDAMPDLDAKIAAEVDKALDDAAPIVEGAKKTADAVAKGSDPGPAIQETGQAVSTFLPPPWNQLALLATTLIATGASLRYRKKAIAGTEVITAIEKTGALDTSKKAALAARMTDAGKRFVDEVTKS